MRLGDFVRPVSPGKCWAEPPAPSPDLLGWLKAGSFAAARTGDPGKIAELLAALRRETLATPVVFVGAGTCGLGAGAGKTLAAIKEWVAAHKSDAQVLETGCIGLCSEEPIVDIHLPGRTRVSFGGVTAEKVPDLLAAVLGKGVIPAGNGVIGQFRNVGAKAWDGVPALEAHSFLRPQYRVVLAASGIIDPSSIDEYIAWGGYSAATKALKTMTPEDVCNCVEASGLRGRGGGGFPTGRKWKFARQAVGDQKYLICNADEGDPGAFMDRAVGESDPHRLLEGMIIAAYAFGATKAYIYIRAEYPLAIKRLTDAIAQARACGLLGRNIFDTGNDLDIVLKMGAGAFVCGEETALIHSIEGRRGMPRPRPPFPAVKGLFGKPTVINNVETLANLPLILHHGAEWYSALGTKGSKGTKVFALSGMVRRTGLVEVPMGTTLRTVVFEAGGGIPNNRKCKAVQIGGPSGGCVPEAHLDLPTDYEALKEFGTIMGSGGMVVVDEGTCMVDFAKFFMEFIQSESCGKCIPCREGTKRMLEILQAVCRPRKREEDIDALLRVQGIMYLQQLGETIKTTSLCGLGQTAPNPVLSTLKWFRDEYEAHIFDRSCPAGACKELVGAPCQNGCPVGTEVWRYVAHISRGEYQDAYRAIRAANPFPSACARVCHHPCERTCRAGQTGGEPIAIRTLKRFVVDRVDPSVGAPVAIPAAENAPKVAVVGAGPSRLAAAHYLSLLGNKVTVFEREAKAGGMLVAAIPAYRLPRQTLNKEIEALLNQNVEIKYGAALGRDVTVDGLFKEGYKAVYLALGAHRSKKLGVPGEDVKGVLPGVTFLKDYNLHGKETAKGRVGIVGGGNSAIDAARVAFREKGVTSVTVFYRRTRQEMPAYAEEIEGALKEGIKIEELVAPVAVLSKNGALTGLRLIRNRLGERDASGRAKPVPVPGSEFEVELDTLIAAISEEAETEGLDGLRKTKWNTVAVNPESYATDRPGVFAGGDMVTGPSTVVAAIAAGKNAALMIDRFLKGKLMRTLPKVTLPTVYIEPVQLPDEDAEPAGRVRAPELPVAKRAKCFAEVELAVSEEAAVCEARRCLRCDLDFTQPE
ncbi:MAG TPA: NADH-ubiquinone oxidoreductase-F iron-sulfur binding region domain-containing protein [Planctomycetota bacterium]|nr:NADH-ubiquinone oxidoreductase-F iron-sulfur binding region domain-containing protein [Planctomycetota bacterium]